MTWDKSLGEVHEVLAGAALRHTLYEDNTPPRRTGRPKFGSRVVRPRSNGPERPKHAALGACCDRNSVHGNIFTPRLNYKWNAPDQWTVVRLSAGSGYWVANTTEDHAALTGARDVVVVSDLNPSGPTT